MAIQIKLIFILTLMDFIFFYFFHLPASRDSPYSTCYNVWDKIMDLPPSCETFHPIHSTVELHELGRCQREMLQKSKPSTGCSCEALTNSSCTALGIAALQRYHEKFVEKYVLPVEADVLAMQIIVKYYTQCYADLLEGILQLLPTLEDINSTKPVVTQLRLKNYWLQKKMRRDPPPSYDIVFNSIGNIVYGFHLEARFGRRFIGIVYVVAYFLANLYQNICGLSLNSGHPFTCALLGIWTNEIFWFHQDWPHLRNSVWVKLSKLFVVVHVGLLFCDTIINELSWRPEHTGLLVGFVGWQVVIWILGKRDQSFGEFLKNLLANAKSLPFPILHKLRHFEYKRIFFAERKVKPKRQIGRKDSRNSRRVSEESESEQPNEAAIALAEEKIAHLREEARMLRDEKKHLDNEKRELRGRSRENGLSSAETQRIRDWITELERSIRELEEEIQKKEDTAHQMGEKLHAMMKKQKAN